MMILCCVVFFSSLFVLFLNLSK
uniref:Uncharacterized protein n=1 Tax=Nelumbo nucifera TaxID=4432 RepID=A0A822Y534_NELNU|nr:TPA_asm: hypothetical protein HUJ06_026182 [Nelumbo nucifera]